MIHISNDSRDRVVRLLEVLVRRLSGDVRASDERRKALKELRYLRSREKQIHAR